MRSSGFSRSTLTPTAMPAPLNNQHAKKPDNEILGSVLKVRCRATDKKRWSRAAPGPLSEWAIRVLNGAASRSLGQKKKS